MQITFRVAAGDVTESVKLPAPVLDANRREIGRMVSVVFDGEWTVATAEVGDEYLQMFEKPPVTQGVVVTCWLCRKPITGRVFYQADNESFPVHAWCLVTMGPPKVGE